MKRIAVLVLLITSCAISMNAQVFYKSGTFKVINAIKTTHYPGVMGSPITTTVTFKLVMKTCGKLNLDSFWMDGLTDKVDVVYSDRKTFDGKPMQGDTLLVNCSYYKMPEERPVNGPGISGSNESAPPVKHKGAILFRYMLKGKTYYFSITDVKKGESVYAP